MSPLPEQSGGEGESGKKAGKSTSDTLHPSITQHSGFQYIASTVKKYSNKSISSNFLWYNSSVQLGTTNLKEIGHKNVD